MNVLAARKTCPRCAERVRVAAKACRYCGAELPNLPVEHPSSSSRWLLLTGLGVATIVAASYALTQIPPAKAPLEAVAPPAQPRFAEKAAPEPSSLHPVLAAGTSLEWTASSSPHEIIRQVGPMTVRISKRVEEDRVAPVVSVSHSGQTVTLEGHALSPTYTHKISAVQNLRGTAPVVMLQSFSGGAHCCNSVTLAGLVRGKLKVVDLGSWDGDTIDTPSDISGDGVADFVIYDNSFLYAFASYASSHAPPVILNVRNGKVTDVSRAPAFRKLFAKSMAAAEVACISGASADERNGACPSYVASAARLGKIEQAWLKMIQAYDARTDWDFPTGCPRFRESCTEAQQIRFQSYPEALLHFLKRGGYIDRGWLPPEYFES